VAAGLAAWAGLRAGLYPRVPNPCTPAVCTYDRCPLGIKLRFRWSKEPHLESGNPAQSPVRDPVWLRLKAPSTIGRERRGNLGVTERILRESRTRPLLQLHTYHKSGNFAPTIFFQTELHFSRLEHGRVRGSSKWLGLTRKA